VPLYEWHCASCARSFEALAALAQAKRRRACPLCGKSSRRVMSAAALRLGPAAQPNEPALPTGRSDVTQLRVPDVARPCWMDDRSAARFAAYKHGRGAEYDDVMAKRAERSRQTGVLEKPHRPRHGHAHAESPLADPAVRARRAAAAARSAAKSSAR
jgi:putative FmdB family regulatory protein